MYFTYTSFGYLQPLTQSILKDETIIDYIKSDDKRKHNEVLVFWEKKFKKKVIGYVYKHSPVNMDGEDIFYRSLMSFFTNLKHLQTFHYSAKLSTYFYKITLNYWREDLRKHKKNYEKFDFSLDQKFDTIQAIISGNTEKTGFKKLNLDDLKLFVEYSKKAIGDDCFKILRLKYSKIKKYSYDDILKLMPWFKNSDTIKSTANRCRDNARKKLYEYYQSLNQ